MDGPRQVEVFESVKLAVLHAGVAPADAPGRALEALDLMALTDQAFKRPRDLSPNERSRLRVGTALAGRPPLDARDRADALESLSRLAIDVT